jgi:hypothetical protein
MTEQELRQLVRDAIAQQVNKPRDQADAHVPVHSISFGQFGVPPGPEGTCIIEPSVMCNHCGYCKSYGH